MKLLNVAGFAAFLFVVSHSSFAHVLTEWECRAYANDAYTVVLAKETGVDKEMVQMALQNYLHEKPTDSYIQDITDLNMTVKMIDAAYSTIQHPLGFAEQEYDKCVEETHEKSI